MRLRCYNIDITDREEMKMKASEIMYYAPVNNTDFDKVAEIAKSISENGWNGAPILVSASHGVLITGSHRIAAIKELDFDPDELGDIAEDVDDIIDAWCEENEAIIDDIDFGNLSPVFAGTWVEQYKDEIAEW